MVWCVLHRLLTTVYCLYTSSFSLACMTVDSWVRFGLSYSFSNNNSPTTIWSLIISFCSVHRSAKLYKFVIKLFTVSPSCCCHWLNLVCLCLAFTVSYFFFSSSDSLRKLRISLALSPIMWLSALIWFSSDLAWWLEALIQYKIHFSCSSSLEKLGGEIGKVAFALDPLLTQCVILTVHDWYHTLHSIQ